MANQVKNYDSATSLTTTPATIFDIGGQAYNTIYVKNEDALDVILNFGGGVSTEQDFIVKAGAEFIQPFACQGVVTARVASGSTTANIFVQVTRG